MERPQVGTNPIISERDTEQYLDFVEGIYAWLPTLQPTLKASADNAVARWEAANGRGPQTIEEIHDALDSVPLVQVRNRMRRDIQEMKYFGIQDDLRAREAELLAELDRYDRMGPGTVDYDPEFVVPDYATRDIHLMPGGYVDHPLAGYMYHYGTKVFFAGKNDDDDVHQRGVDRLPVPADGVVRRILDIGCSSGQSATALKRRFPEAEVWGIDVGIPMVRYAHKRAVDMGLDVHFAQRLAEDTGFPDGSFDIVHSFIVFHELPLEIGERVVREAARLLRPGGMMLITDFHTKHAPRGDVRGNSGALGELTGHVDHLDNCEPYAFDFTHSDFEGMLGRHFSSVEVRREGYGMPLRVAIR